VVLSAQCAACGQHAPYAIVVFAVKFPSWEGWSCAKHMDGVVFLCAIPGIDISLHEMRFYFIGPIAIGPYDNA
jgi:hypothetical protein